MGEDTLEDNVTESFGNDLRGRERALVGGGGNRMRRKKKGVTPHVSKPHDYVNHMFNRP
jgi:hypothetical protein